MNDNEEDIVVTDSPTNQKEEVVDEVEEVEATETVDEVEEVVEDKKKDVDFEKIQRRIDKLTYEKQTERQKVEQLERELNQLKNQPKHEDLDPEDTRIQKAVQTQLAYERQVEAERKAELDRQNQWNKWQRQIEKAESTKLPDWHEVVSESTAPTSTHMMEAIVDSDNGTEISYHLAKHPDEAERIFKLSPVQQVKEIFKLGITLAEPKTKKKTDAPKPITPVGSNKKTGDLRDDMPYDDWEKKRNAESRIKR